MLKLRIIGCVLVKNGIAVQSINFKKYLPIGKPETVVEFLSNWDIDEIVVLNIDSYSKSKLDFDLIKGVSKKAFVPLTAGGKIRSIEDIRNLLLAGADKVCINSSAFNNIELIREASGIFGNQCIVVSIDVKKSDGIYEVFIKNGKEGTGVNVLDHIKKVVEAGAGEIFLNSIDRDGSKSGFDLELFKRASEGVAVPLIACGGAGHPDHFVVCMNTSKVASIAAGNFFNYTEHSVRTLKAYIASKSITNLRLGATSKYIDFSFDSNGRINKLSDQQLIGLKFIPVEQEVI